MLYMRKWRLIVKTWRGADIVITDPLRVTFRIDKNISRMFQFGEITIYNLNSYTETDILQNGKSVILEAGYESGGYGQIFSGPIRQPIRGKADGTTYFIKLVCIDGDDFLNSGFGAFTLAAGQTPQLIAQQVARNSSVPFDVNIGNLNNEQTTVRGKTVFGPPSDTLRNIASNNNAAFYVDDGVAKISPLSQAPPAIVPELNATTGLVGMPQQVDYGVQIRSLVNPNFILDSWVKLNNQNITLNQVELGVPQTLLDVDGVYRIIEISINGDTRGNDWYCDMLTISQTGALPFMLSGTNQQGM